ncbi:protein of unknown function DUF1127 [Methylophilales phage Melnitz EXVC044M]|nr:hypothetical protein Melnitz1EXVC043M_45 [Methylophilales phage Melnitz-1 EXVC043M]QZI94557.1 protein of unknown function DUF1127 [Methylophilales phage Melnitz-2 EXVC040M]QZI94779.1 protein of unknown function DUF1127 [Methylophilales phage Melnitz EXVC044M]QZI95000.1 protein of unknown function DUF1127 [Methylophilales phage Melnitz-3 EXVC039M]
MTVLTQTYCAFCDIVSDLYKNFRNVITPKIDKKIYRELASLTDRELNDMGICRGDITSIAMGKHVPRDGWTK